MEDVDVAHGHIIYQLEFDVTDPLLPQGTVQRGKGKGKGKGYFGRKSMDLEYAWTRLF